MIRWGIIGCGDVCEIKSGPAFYKCNGSSLVAVMRRDESKAKDFAQRHHVPKYYSNADDLIRDPDVDIIYIATPPENHAELTIKVLNAGKPVYVEKPMGRNYMECEKMIETSKLYNQKLFVAYYRRSLPYFLKVKELLEANTIGKVQVVQCEFFRSALPSDIKESTHTWRLNKTIAGGGYFYDMASHTIDILMFLLGKIKKTKGISANTGKLYEVEDTISASFLFESEIIGSAIWCYVSSKIQEKDSIEIIGEKGSILFSTFDFSDIVLNTEGNIKKFNYSRPVHIQMDMIQSIVDELNGKGVCPSTGESGSWTNWVMEKIIND